MESINKHGTFDSEGVDQIVQVLPLDNADIFQATNAVIPERKRFLFDPAKRADGQETLGWLTLLPRLKGGRRDGTSSQIEAEAGS